MTLSMLNTITNVWYGGKMIYFVHGCTSVNTRTFTVGDRQQKTKNKTNHVYSAPKRGMETV